MLEIWVTTYFQQLTLSGLPRQTAACRGATDMELDCLEIYGKIDP